MFPLSSSASPNSERSTLSDSPNEASLTAGLGADSDSAFGALSSILSNIASKLSKSTEVDEDEESDESSRNASRSLKSESAPSSNSRAVSSKLRSMSSGSSKVSAVLSCFSGPTPKSDASRNASSEMSPSG